MTTTSEAAYFAAKASGLLARLRGDIYDFLYLNGPQTARYVFKKLGIFPGSATPRFAELEKMGVIEKVGEREEDGVRSTVWAVTLGYPKKLPKSRSYKSRLELLLNAIEEVKDLDQLKEFVASEYWGD